MPKLLLNGWRVTPLLVFVLCQQAVIRSSLVDAEGTSWRCPVCGFDNRPLCKHCDLCGISSEFAEVR